jgi:hypothetical protein
MTAYNLALEQDQDQRIQQAQAALEYKIEQDSFSTIRAEAYSCGLCGDFPKNPNSPIYFKAWCDGFEQYAIAVQKEEEAQQQRLAWAIDMPF